MKRVLSCACHVLVVRIHTPHLTMATQLAAAV